MLELYCFIGLVLAVRWVDPVLLWNHALWPCESPYCAKGDVDINNGCSGRIMLMGRLLCDGWLSGTGLAQHLRRHSAGVHVTALLGLVDSRRVVWPRLSGRSACSIINSLLADNWGILAISEHTGGCVLELLACRFLAFT